MRRLISVPLVVIGIVAVTLGSLLWWADQQIFDTAKLVQHSQEILAKPAIQSELRSALVGRVLQLVGSDKFKAQIDQLVLKELADPTFRKDFTDSIGAAQQSLVDPASPVVRLDLSAVAGHIAAELQATNPTAASFVSGGAGALRFDLVRQSQLPHSWRLLQKWHGFGPLYFGLGIVLIAIGLIVGPGRWGLLVTAGVGVVLLSLASVLAAKYAVSSAVAHTALPTDRAAVKAVAQPFIDDLTTQSVIIGVAGLVVALIGAGLGVMGVGRVPTSEWSAPSNFRQATWR